MADAKQEELLEELHSFYKAGNLRILAGAGISKASSFPDWDELNRELLKQYLHASRAENGQIVAGLVESLYESLEREGTAELVHRSLGGEFRKTLSQALYRGRPIGEIPLTELHWQVAALAFRRDSPGPDGNPWLRRPPFALRPPTSNRCWRSPWQRRKRSGGGTRANLRRAPGRSATGISAARWTNG